MTLAIFCSAFLRFIENSIKYLISHPVFTCLILPSTITWLLLEQIPGPYTEAVNLIEFSFEYVIWWVGLGVLSSIGLGSGLQSGVIFLFPHIIKVCLAAETCNTLEFESMSDIWMRNPPNLFICQPADESEHLVSFLGVWSKIWLPSFLWSAGTALGEIPPFWMSRASRLAAIAAGDVGGEDSDGVPEELSSTSDYKFVNAVKAWMIRFLNNHGFFGVLMMASWPNVAFDLCGICCGHFLMPFETFFGATFIGKAIIRNTYQSMLIVAMIR